MKYATYICGGDTSRLDERGTCPNILHNWPLPRSYCDAAAMADSRMAHHWSNTKCPDCGGYGWTPGMFAGLAAESIEVRMPDA